MNEYEKKEYRFLKTQALIDVNKKSVLEREKQIKLFEKDLMKYRIFISDLAVMNISEKMKNELLSIAFFVVNNGRLLERFEKTKEIPVDVICKEYIKPKAIIKYWRDYIIAYVLILSNSRYKAIQDYIKVVEVVDILGEKNLLGIEGKKNSKGLILAKTMFSTIILTSSGEFKKVKLEKTALIGEEIESRTKKRLSEQRNKIIGVIIVIAVSIGLFTAAYMNVKSTILVKTTSAIVLEINSFNRVKSINSETEKGKQLVDSIEVIDRNIDYAILQIVKYAKNNEMIPNTGIVITVNGDKIRYGYLEDTENYLFLEGIEVKLNNSGIEQDLK